jgi:hypothetical protein
MYIPVPVPQPGQPQMPVQYPGHPMMMTFQQRFSTFGIDVQRRRFLEIDQSETRIAYGSHVC